MVYKKPTFNVIFFDVDDVITTSTATDTWGGTSRDISTNTEDK